MQQYLYPMSSLIAFKSFIRKIGDCDGISGVSGTLTATSFGKILDFFNLALMDVFLDIGAGVCHALFYATDRAPGIKSYGIENDPIKLIKARAALEKFNNNNSMTLIEANIEELPQLPNNTTHVYIACEGMPPTTIEAIMKLIDACKTVKKTVFVARHGQGFECDNMALVQKIPVTLQGGGTRLQAYCYELNNI